MLSPVAKKMNIVQLTTHEFPTVLVGAHLRMRNIAEILKANGANTYNISMLPTDDKNSKSKEVVTKGRDIEFYRDISLEMKEPQYVPEFMKIVASFQNDLERYALICRYMKKISPDIILLEHGWFWPVVKRMKKEGIIPKNTRVIYSSHNVEHKTLASQLANEDMEETEIKKALGLIYELEQELCTEADAIICCTQADASVFRTMGAKRIFVGGNGARRPRAKKWPRQPISKPLKHLKHIKDFGYALFVGGPNYNPNASGFWQLFGNSLAFLPPDCSVFVVGNIYRARSMQLDTDRMEYAVNRERIRFLGVVPDQQLWQLVERCSVIILPIVEGGGSNIKTAEAIVSGKPIVAAPMACRGFDWAFEELSDFVVAEDSDAFRRAVLYYLENPVADGRVFSEREQEFRESVLWQKTLEPIVGILK